MPVIKNLMSLVAWKWYPTAHGRDPDFTPQGKVAEAVMAEYFLGD
jgi:hypothetical protein